MVPLDKLVSVDEALGWICSSPAGAPPPKSPSLNQAPHQLNMSESDLVVECGGWGL